MPVDTCNLFFFFNGELKKIKQILTLKWEGKNNGSKYSHGLMDFISDMNTYAYKTRT